MYKQVGTEEISMKIKDSIFAITGFVRITDENNQLSVTNLLVALFAYKFFNTPITAGNITDLAGSLVSLAPLLGAIGNYAYKKKLSTQTPAQDPTPDVPPQG